MNILLVCTANQCRSPMAEGILRQRVEAAGLPVHVSSAGVLQGGAPATEHAVTVCRSRGIDISGHVSRRIDKAMVEDSDLVIAMAREHLREAVVLSPPAFNRTFTLRELARRVSSYPQASIAELARGREIRDYVKSEPDDDVADPVGLPLSKYEQTVTELDALLSHVALWLPNVVGEQVAS